MESIHHHFVKSIQLMPSRYHIFNTIAEWISCIKEALELDAIENQHLSEDTTHQKLVEVLSKELETWELLAKLYFYRLKNSDNDDNVEMTDEGNEEVVNEKINEIQTVRKLVENDQQLKEVALTLEWLESIYRNKTVEPVLITKDINWENTLAALKRDELHGTVTSEFMVTQIDPDACLRENKKLHQLDVEDDAKAQKAAFHYIRCGDPEKAINYLKESGHIAKAASLQGYEYTEIVNLGENVPETSTAGENLMEGESEKPRSTYRILGNEDRDLWKRIAYIICDTKKEFPKMEKAALGALCGHRQSMLDVAGNWEDKLWTFLKTLLDVQLEEQLRAASVDFDSYVAMPESYWLQKMDLPECISKIQDSAISSEVTIDSLFTIVQQCILLDDVGNFLKILQQNISKILESNVDQVIIGHIHRFLTHVILFFGIVELDKNFLREEEMIMNICSEAYIKVLVNVGQLCYIPFYVNKLSEYLQINAVISNISPSMKISVNDINCFLEAISVNDLNVLQIAIAIVDKFRAMEEDFNVHHLHWIAGAYHFSDNKPKSMVAFLRLTLLISRKYIVLGNLGLVRKLLGEVNDLCTSLVMSYSKHYEDTYIREFLCYKAYLEAEDSLIAWRRALGRKPVIEPETSDDLMEEINSRSLSIADRSRKDSRKFNFEESNKKWRSTVDHFIKVAIDKFIQLLKFPNGWLLDCISTEEEDKENADETTIASVRRIMIPKITFVLLKLVQETNSQDPVRQFLYTFCDDAHHIYQEMSSTDIAIVFKAIEEFTRASPEEALQKLQMSQEANIAV